MSATLSTLPVWKQNATPSEWLAEMAAIALVYPERFSRIVVVYEEANAEGYLTKMRFQSYKHITNLDMLGALERAKLEIFEYMKDRRS